MEKKFKVESSILVMAMRYAMGRQTFAPTIVVDNIKNNISLFDSTQIDLLIRDIEEYGESFSFGMDCDKSLWLGFRDYLADIITDRRSNPNDIDVAKSVLKDMENMKGNPNDIVGSRYRIGEVLAEWGIDIGGGGLEQHYEEFKALVERELSRGK